MNHHPRAFEDIGQRDDDMALLGYEAPPNSDWRSDGRARDYVTLDNVDGQPAAIFFSKKPDPYQGIYMDGTPYSDEDYSPPDDPASDRPESRLAVTVYLAIAVVCLTGLLGWLTFG